MPPGPVAPDPAAGAPTVAVAQLTCTPGDLAANLAAHVELVGRARRLGARVVVFPELSLTGYELGAIERDPALTLAPADERLLPLIEACRGWDGVAVAGAPVARGRRRVLGAIVVGRDGIHEVYAKQHLGDGEAGVFEPGRRDVVVDVAGRRLGLSICFDSAHPEHAERCRGAGADVYLVGAMFVEGEERKLAERMAERARSLGLWIALAQHTGPSSYGPACGGSGIWSPHGAPVARLERESPALALATIA